ncbi:LysR family transcriptional regulator [Streptomyces sp. VRA16 Mangrove soil]|uniref:LysR family transcriptional regulator n=1 Tax=Streptomyces sp. VRA16 Mangrove soil TaxID=2817434 RepID=UPI001A9F4741|nr:LysR family transcriptional regulator [Streptomyces sp. VRA16 Mangrove soil]MBO1334395.1 LysR family transcriptional regulator [Streptomyces sp. VRA16 Mangrove soil]
MDLHTLEQFLVVARLEHLSRAATELRVAQPSLSRTVARLEAELGTPLFDRCGRMRLNAAGRLFRDHVERALGELNAGRRAVAEATCNGVGGVRLAAETFLTVTGPLTAFKRAHPDVDVELHQMAATDMHRALRAHEVDLCVASQPIPGAGLDSVHLHDEPVWLAVPPEHPLTSRASVRIDELRDEPFVISRPGHWQRRLLDQLFAARNLSPRIVCEGDEPAATSMLVSAGMGLSLVPDVARLADVSAPGSWLRVEDPGCVRTLTLHRAAGSRWPSAVRLMHTALTTWAWGGTS